MKQYKSEYCWKFDWSPDSRVWRMTWRATGQLLGLVKRDDLPGGGTAHVGKVWSGERWVNLGYYDHWTKAKKAVQSAHVGIRLHGAVQQ